MAWGDKGEEFRSDRCIHPSSAGCMWCCPRCNYDRHYCPGCGAVSDHHDTPCDECLGQIERGER